MTAQEHRPRLPLRTFCPHRGGRFCGGPGWSGGEGSRVLVTAKSLSLFGPQEFSPVEEAEYLGGW